MSGERIAILARLDYGVSGGGRADRLARVLAGAGHEVAVAALGDGPAVEDARGYRLLRPPRTRPAPGPLGYVREDPQLGRAAAALRPDLVIATDPPTLRQAVGVAGGSQARVIYDSWELYPDQVEQTVPHRWFRPILVALLRRSVLREERRCLPRTSGVILTSEGHRRIFVERHRARLPDEIAIVRNLPFAETPGPDDHLRRETGAADGERVLVYAGSLGPSRGLLDLVEAARRLPPGHRVAVMGWGWLEGEIRRRAPGNLTVLPPVPADRLISVLAGADLGLLPIEAGNLSKVHSLANKLFEYLMAGLPVLATDLPEQRRVLEGTGAGVLVPDASPESIVAGVERVFARESESPGSFREAALRLARERYSLERDAPALLAAVRRSLIGSAR